MILFLLEEQLGLWMEGRWLAQGLITGYGQSSLGADSPDSQDNAISIRLFYLEVLEERMSICG